MSNLKIKSAGPDEGKLSDPQNFVTMTNQFYGYIYYTALSLVRDPEMAHDIAQETFLRAWIKRESITQPATRLLPWLSRIARNLAVQWIRQGQRRSRLVPLVSMEDETVQPVDTSLKDPREAAIATEEKSQLITAVMELPAELRQAVLLHYAEGMTAADIARLNGESKSTITRRLKKANEKLRLFIEESLPSGLATLKPGNAKREQTLQFPALLTSLSSSAQIELLKLVNEMPMPGPGEIVTGNDGTVKSGTKSLSDVGSLVVSLKTVIIGFVILSSLGTYAVKTELWKSYYSNSFATQHTELQTNGKNLKTELNPAHASTANPSAANRRSSRVKPPSSTSSPTKKPSAYGPLPPVDQRVSFSGNVVDKDGAPVSNAIVRVKYKDNIRLVEDASSKATTSADGSFKLSNVLPGDIGLAIYATGYAPVVQWDFAPSTETKIALSSKGASLSGVVLNDLTGEPLPGTTITLDANYLEIDQPSTLSDSKGEFVFNHLPAAEYIIRAEYPGLGLLPNRPGLFSFSRIKLKMYKLAEGDIADGIVLHMDKGRTVKGNVRDSATGKPVAGVKLRSVGFYYSEELASAVTDSAGNYKMDNVVGSAGIRVWFWLDKPGYIHQPKQQYGAENSPMFDLDDEENGTHDFVMTPAVSVSGIIKDETGKPVTKAILMVDSDCSAGQSEPFYSDALGKYAVFLPPHCNSVLTVRKTGMQSMRQPVHTDDVAIVQDIKMARGVTLGGVVLDTNGLPLENASVEAYMTPPTAGSATGYTTFGGNTRIGQTVTDKNGRFALGNMPVKDVIITGNKSGYASSSTSIVPTDNQLSDNTVIQLSGGKSIEGLVIDQSGKPVDEVRVILIANSIIDEPVVTSSNADGIFVFDSLPDKAFNIRAQHPTLGIANASKVVPGGDPVKMVLGSPTSPRLLTVNVVDWKTRKPVDEFKVLKPSGVIRSDQSGVFAQEEITPGQSVRYIVSSPGYALMDSGYLQSPDADSTPVLTFAMGPGATLTGQLKAPENTTISLSGIEVRIPSPIDSESDGLRTLTDGNGAFKFERVPTGTRKVLIKSPSPAAEIQKEFESDNGSHINLKDVPLTLGRRVTGQITKGESRKPIRGAKVEIGELNQPKTITSTDEDGRYEFDGLGTLDYWVSVPEYSLESWTKLDSDSPSTTRCDFEIGDAKVSGQILQNGSPASQAIVNFSKDGNSRKVVVNGNGSFSVDDLTGGDYVIRANGLNQSSRLLLSIKDGQSTSVVINLESGTIQGTVVDSKDQPIPGVMVSFNCQSVDIKLRTGYGATTEEDGTFSVSGMQPGKYVLVASIDEKLITSVYKTIVPPSGVNENLRLKVSDASASIESITRNPDGTPNNASSTKIVIQPVGTFQKISKQRDENGVLLIEDLPPGEYEMWITAPGSKPIAHTVDLKDGDFAKFDDVVKAEWK